MNVLKDEVRQEPPSTERKLYPSWRFHPGGRSQIINTREEDEALGEGWYNSPALFPVEQPEPPPPAAPPVSQFRKRK